MIPHGRLRGLIFATIWRPLAPLRVLWDSIPLKEKLI